MRDRRAANPIPSSVLLTTALLLGVIGWSWPLFAQTDFSGEWQPVRNQDNAENPLVGDWVGIPLDLPSAILPSCNSAIV